MSVSSIPHAKRVRSQALKDTARATKRATRARSAMDRQLKGLLATKIRDTYDTGRTFTNITATYASCLTSVSSITTAPSGSGLIPVPGNDATMINHVRLKGFVNLPLYSEVVTIIGTRDSFVRFLLVWYHKPLLVADNAGTLPLVTEVLNTDDIHSFPIQEANNGGRFVILSDRLFNVGMNAMLNIAPYTAYNAGKTRHYFDYTVPINRMITYVQPPTATEQGGHYDSDVAYGRVSSGLLVLYTQVSRGGSSAAITVELKARLNFTG